MYELVFSLCVHEYVSNRHGFVIFFDIILNK